MSHEKGGGDIVLEVGDPAADSCNRQVHPRGRFGEASGLRHRGENAQGRKIELLHRS
jgi:hypothetical protein